MSGRVVTPKEFVIADDINMWKSNLNNPDGKIRLNAAYNLALSNEYDVLIKRLHNNNVVFRLEAAYALTACRYNKEAIDKLQDILKKEKDDQVAFSIAFIFSEMGSTTLNALPVLIHVVQKSDSYLVKQYCCEALGTIQANRQDDIDGITQCLTNILSDRGPTTDPKAASHLRFTAALSIAKIGHRAIQAIPQLKEALYLDENRYVNGNALLALERIGTNEALKILLDYLKVSRWCAKTTVGSQY